MDKTEAKTPKPFREVEISKILDFTSAGKFCQLVCAPGVGKATLLKILAQNKKTGTNFIYINFMELTNFDEIAVVNFLLFSLDNTHTADTDLLQAKQEFKEAIEKLIQTDNLVFLFDHFDEIQNHLNRPFYQLLKDAKSLSSYRFAVVFATRRDLQFLVDEQIVHDYWNFFVDNTVYLKVYDQDSIEHMFAQIEEALGKKVSAEDKKGILVLTGGHAKLTKITTELYLGQKISLEIGDILKNQQVLATLFEIWLFLTSQEQHELHILSRKAQQVESPNQDDLVKFDIISESGEFTIPIFKEFVKSQPLESSQKLAFNPQTREITRGTSDILELLSPQEYRLLSFLIENEGKIVSRDDLISAVWPKTQVTEAISDEAIDQMVFRLRKKVENEPKKPEHILTIKGHGIKFVQ